MNAAVLLALFAPESQTLTDKYFKFQRRNGVMSMWR